MELLVGGGSGGGGGGCAMEPGQEVTSTEVIPAGP